jgi:predicted TIM-barrel fold metal-dependent hydrolase
MSQLLERREFLVAAGAAQVSAWAWCSGSAAAEERVPRVDAHLHCFAGPKDARFPYHERAPYRPEEAATPEHLIACMDGAGVDFAVVVHPEPYQDDHRYLEHCLQVGGKRLKGTALVFADRPGSVERLPDLVRKLNVVTVRVHAYTPERLPPFGKPELRNLWKQASDLGLAVQLHFEPRWAPGFEPLIQEFSQTRVIIDHMGRPFQGSPEEHAVVVRWSRFPNTVMKLSSLPPTTTYPHREIQPVVRQLTDAYGADRMIYGGGFNASANSQSYRAAFDRVASLLSHLPTADQAKILGANAVRLFGFARTS